MAAFALAAALVLACSTEAVTDGTLPDSGAGDATATDAAVDPAFVAQSGRALVVQANTPIALAKVTAGGRETATDSEGGYSLLIPRGKPITLKISASEHYQFIEQEYVVDKSPYDRGDSLVLSKTTANLLKAFIGNYDDTRGLLVVKVIPMRGCASEGGTVLTMEPSGAEVRYTTGGLPGNGTSLSAGENNGALFYNITPGVPVKVLAKHPTCALMPFPVDYQGVRYTGAQTTEAGESFSFIRVFLGPGPTADAGPVDSGPVDSGSVDGGSADAADSGTD